MKRPLAAIAAIAAALAVGAAQAGVERSIGAPAAKVTVIEYASVGCPHCAAWATSVFPQFKARFIDTGQVRFVFREMLTGDPALAAAGFLLANCAPPAKFFEIVNAIFADQERVESEGGEALLRIAKGAGLDAARAEACLTDEAALKALQDDTDRDAAEHGVSATPTFIVGDDKMSGDVSLEALSAAIDRARR